MKDCGKFTVKDLVIFGGFPCFSDPKPTSSLVQPELSLFLDYSRLSFEANQYTNNGPVVQLLEHRLAAFHRAERCIAFCSGFWAIALTLKCLALKGKTEVIMPSLTYRRMADIAAWVGLTPRFSEVSEDNLSISPEAIRACITSQTAIILAAHPTVNCCNVSEIVGLAESFSIPIVFDSVESVYETVPQGKIGEFGDAECFSLHASKLINGFEGGYVTTNNLNLAAKLGVMRAFGFTQQDRVTIQDGMNAKLCELHAAMALANLDRIEITTQQNRERYQAYRESLARIDFLRLLEYDESLQTGYKNIIIEVLPSFILTRDELLKILNSELILARAYYSPPLHQREMAYRHIATKLPITERLSNKFLSMPCGELVTIKDIRRICALLEYISYHRCSIKNRIIKTGIRL